MAAALRSSCFCFVPLLIVLILFINTSADNSIEEAKQFQGLRNSTMMNRFSRNDEPTHEHAVDDPAAISSMVNM
ncbi:hypothetical protein T459_18446 [Capsicum annuum]|uniref:Uncharacterized protein n=2 Tax=Capsicum annuum TaxID=4072 RepID=A0A2G2ZEL5_CAPAN|nr:hypothetical protein T459_18446 [Capsicum annuum]